MVMYGEIVETGNKKYGILAEFEVGNSGVWEQRMLVSGLSMKKAKELYEKNKIKHLSEKKVKEVV